MARTRTKYRNNGPSIPGWPTGTDRWGMATGTDEAPCPVGNQFVGKTATEIIILVTEVAPVAAAGKKWIPRDCSVDVIVTDLGEISSEGPVGGTGDGSGFDNSYTYARTGTDAAGTPFVSTPAPALVAISQQAPRLLGNDYAFVSQTALNTVLAKRHPPFTIGWLVVYAGVNFSLLDDREGLLSRGYNLVAENVPNRGNLTRTRLAPLVPGGYDLAQAAANEIEATNPADPRIAWLRAWTPAGNLRQLIDNQPAAQAFGNRVWRDYLNSDWSNELGLWGITPNFEVYNASPNSANDAETQWRNMDGYFMEGVRVAALAAGKTPPALVMYDWATICHFNLRLKAQPQQASGVFDQEGYTRNYTPEVGIPYYFSYSSIGNNFHGGTPTAPLAALNPYAQYIKQYGGYAGSAEYMRNTWDEETKWQKNPDGTFKTRVVGGVTLRVPRTDARRTLIAGEVTDLLGAGYYSVGEADNFLYLIYERIQQAIVDTYMRAGAKHLPLSTDRQTDWEELKLVQWARLDAEFKQVNEVTKPDNSGPAINPATGQAYDTNALNRRPLNPHFVERDLIMQLLLGRDMYRPWMETLENLSAQGVASTSPRGLAVIEIQQKAMNRLSKMSWVQQQTIQYLIPQYFVGKLARDRSWYDPNDEFEKKPIVFWGLCPARTDRNSKPWVFVCASYPAQDLDEYTDGVYWWVDASGNAITPGYPIRKQGRSTHLDDHQVPDAVAALPPNRLRYQFTDLMGQKQTWTGDYRTPKITNHPTPPNPQTTN